MCQPQRERDGVLVVDDCPITRRAIRRVLNDFMVMDADNAGAALDVLGQGRNHVQAILCDLHLGDGDSGLGLLRRLRDDDVDLPFVLLTGGPDMQTAIEAVELGAFGYLTKPFDHQQLVDIVARATHERRLVEAERRSSHCGSRPGTLIRLESQLDLALASLTMAYQPIVSVPEKKTVGFEALLRSSEPSLPHPGAVLDAAERLDRIWDVGSTVRSRVQADLDTYRPQGLLFLNLHPNELMDQRLLDESEPIVSRASGVVLELTERQLIDDPALALRRVSVLRERGYAIAIDDLGAGYASLNVFAALRPEYVKLDMALVQAVNENPFTRELIRAINRLCVDQGIVVVAEGVETSEQRDTLLELGCEIMQGYLFARPAAQFPQPEWS